MRMGDFGNWLGACLLVAALFLAAGQALAGTAEEVRERLRQRIEYAQGKPVITVGEERLHSSAALPIFYEARGYMPAWLGPDAPSETGGALLRAVMGAGEHGLSPSDYHAEKIRAVLAEAEGKRSRGLAPNPGRMADLDLLLTDAFLIYGAHLLGGKVDPETIEPTWAANKREADLPAVLEEALRSGDIEGSLERLSVRNPAYGVLKEALKRYRAAAEGARRPMIRTGTAIKPGSRGPEVAILRARLTDLAFLRAEEGGAAEFFDPLLEEALKRFQEANGLDPDGVCGRATAEALNEDPMDRVGKIRVNMERWRWLPQDLGENRIEVNAADYRLAVIEDGAPVLQMKAIVGKPYRKTPVFSAKMTYLVVSPFWNVPPSIAVKDKLPLIQKDPGYLAANHFMVFQGWGAEAREIDPGTVDWKALGPGKFPYRLRQDPGPDNALGRLKFMFPNKFNVYIHDTPTRDLFAKNQRNFSSGCIRIEKPVELAEYMLRGNPEWSREALERAIEKREERTVVLPRPLPVHIVYFTAFADAEGRVRFRNDAYDRDPKVLEALDKAPAL